MSTTRTGNAKWKDATSYSRGERGKSEPNAWSLDLGAAIEITVHRYLSLPGWYVSTRGALEVSRHELAATSVEAARIEAVGYINTVVNNIAAAMKGAEFAKVEEP
jgi:hypothetical protein